MPDNEGRLISPLAYSREASYAPLLLSTFYATGHKMGIVPGIDKRLGRMNSLPQCEQLHVTRAAVAAGAHVQAFEHTYSSTKYPGHETDLKECTSLLTMGNVSGVCKVCVPGVREASFPL